MITYNECLKKLVELGKESGYITFKQINDILPSSPFFLDKVDDIIFDLQQDGIEIALIRIDKAAKKLCFSGAGLHLLHYSLNGLEHVRGDRYGLGGLKWHQELAFNEVVIPYKEQSRIYLYTDGIIDQPQVDKTKIRRFGHPKWLEFIGTIAEKPLSEQQESCLELLDGMLAFHEQRDDITVIGIGL